jgi:hypothetical protein
VPEIPEGRRVSRFVRIDRRSAPAFALALALALCALLTALPAAGQPRPERKDIWNLRPGMRMDGLSGEFVDMACGTNGGPPSIPLKGFEQFMRCKPEASGLREIYFRYDDELEYWARSLGLEDEARRFRGTQAFDFPVIVSVLLDPDGVIRGIRIVTDPRDDARDRVELWTLANFLKHNFGAPGWECVRLPAQPGEEPAGSFFVKDRCEKIHDGKRLTVENHFYRKKGHAALNIHTGQPQADNFESMTRFEMVDVGGGAGVSAKALTR